jgi:hypothetical protein
MDAHDAPCFAASIAASPPVTEPAFDEDGVVVAAGEAMLARPGSPS